VADEVAWEVVELGLAEVGEGEGEEEVVGTEAVMLTSGVGATFATAGVAVVDVVDVVDVVEEDDLDLQRPEVARLRREVLGGRARAAMARWW
jgi:hypothetical protein